MEYGHLSTKAAVLPTEPYSGLTRYILEQFSF